MNGLLQAYGDTCEFDEKAEKQGVTGNSADSALRKQRAVASLLLRRSLLSLFSKFGILLLFVQLSKACAELSPTFRVYFTFFNL